MKYIAVFTFPIWGPLVLATLFCLAVVWVVVFPMVLLMDLTFSMLGKDEWAEWLNSLPFIGDYCD